MATVLIAVGALVFYVVAYYTYGRWLAHRIFGLDPDSRTPALEMEDGVDYVPSRKEVVFGHHFTSIAGTGPIVGPAIAIIWGWLPALIWVLVGSVMMGAVHDFGAVVMSLRSKGASIADLTGSVICRRARVLLLAVVFFELLIVVAVFAIVIATIFDIYPQSVIPVWLEIPIAFALGAIMVRKKGAGTLVLASVGAVTLMYVTVVIGAYAPLKMPWVFGLPPTFLWAVALFVYAYFASVLPVHRLLQPRDFINSHQLLIAIGLLMLGVFFAHPAIVAPALNANLASTERGAGAPPFFPFLFITVACGAISGFHSLVGSGTSSKQISSESDAQMIGYGSMLLEGFLAVLVIIAVGAGIGLHYEQKFTFGVEDAQVLKPELEEMSLEMGYSPGQGLPGTLTGPDMPAAASEQGLSTLKSMGEFHERNPELSSQSVVADGASLTFALGLEGKTAWNEHYRSWSAAGGGLRPKLKAFVDGAANMMAAFGIPAVVGLAIMGVFVASFAGTTLDTATRLQRYIISELGRTARVRALENRYLATGVAVVTAAALALWDGKGAGGMTLWPLFGALNQLLASLALLIIAVYLYRRRKPTWMVTFPFAFMLVVTAWAMVINVSTFLQGAQWHLLVISAIVLALQLWITVEAAIIWVRIRREREQAPPAASPGSP